MTFGSCPKHNKRILFLVDHKHRDLPSLSLIGYFLRQMGYKVKYVALWQEDLVIRSFQPKYLVLPKPIYELKRQIRFKIRGHKLIVIDTEGNPGGKRFKLNIQIPPDLYFFWNESELQIAITSLSSANTILKLAGCPRTDFLKDKFLDLFPSREELLQQYSLSLQRKTVTIATATANAYLSGELLKRKIEQLKRQTLEIDNIKEGVRNMVALKDMTERMIRHIVPKYSELNFVIKPHPNESIISWQDLVDSLPTDNAYLCIGESIHHLLRVSDLSIAHNGCSTTFESLLSGVPAVEIHTDESIKFFKIDRLQLPTYSVKTVEELDHVIERELYHDDRSKVKDPQISDKLGCYIHKYFYKIDGLRCYEHAREIAKFIEDARDESNYYGKFLVNNPLFLWPYVKSQIRRPFSYVKRFFKKVFFRSSVPKVDESNDVDIDSRGRYDNRIKPGDEEYWFEKFEKAGFRLEDFETSYLAGLRNRDNGSS